MGPPRWVHTKAAAISTSRPARTLCKVAVAIRVAQEAPAQAPARLPARRLTATSQYAVSSLQGTATSRAGSAVNTTAKLIALFTITACRARKPNSPISSGSPKLRTAETDHAAQQPDRSAGAERRHR